MMFYPHFPTVTSNVFNMLNLVMPSTLKKLKGHIAFGSCVRASVRPSVRPSV